MAETPSFVEGEEEAQYLFVPLSAKADATFITPGATVILEDLATAHPKLRLGVGQLSSSSSTQPVGTSTGGSSSNSGTTVLEGQYVDTLGSILFVKEQPRKSHKEQPTFTYIGHTDKQLQFKPPT